MYHLGLAVFSFIPVALKPLFELLVDELRSISTFSALAKPPAAEGELYLFPYNFRQSKDRLALMN